MYCYRDLLVATMVYLNNMITIVIFVYYLNIMNKTFIRFLYKTHMKPIPYHNL